MLRDELLRANFSGEGQNVFTRWISHWSRSFRDCLRSSQCFEMHFVSALNRGSIKTHRRLSASSSFYFAPSGRILKPGFQMSLRASRSLLSGVQMQALNLPETAGGRFVGKPKVSSHKCRSVFSPFLDTLVSCAPSRKLTSWLSEPQNIAEASPNNLPVLFQRVMIKNLCRSEELPPR